MATSSTRIFENYETEYLKVTKVAATNIELVDQLLPPLGEAVKPVGQLAQVCHRVVLAEREVDADRLPVPVPGGPLRAPG